MTEDDRWRWHAYHYGWRRVFLEDFRKVSPIDEPGHWYSPDMASRTEEFFRTKHDRPPKWRPRQPSGQDAVRADWKKISAHDMTDAEHKLADPLIAAMSSRAKRFIAQAAEKWRKAFRDKHTHYEARDGIERPVTPATVDVPPEELMARVGVYAIKRDAS